MIGMLFPLFLYDSIFPLCIPNPLLLVYFYYYLVRVIFPFVLPKGVDFTYRRYWNWKLEDNKDWLGGEKRGMDKWKGRRRLKEWILKHWVEGLPAAVMSNHSKQTDPPDIGEKLYLGI